MYWEISFTVPVMRCWAMKRQSSSRVLRASSLPARAWFTSPRIRPRMGSLSSRPSSYPQAFNAAAMVNSVSELTSEIASPEGSTSEGAFSCVYVDEDEELWGPLPAAACLPLGAALPASGCVSEDDEELESVWADTKSGRANPAKTA